MIIFIIFHQFSMDFMPLGNPTTLPIAIYPDSVPYGATRTLIRHLRLQPFTTSMHTMTIE